MRFFSILPFALFALMATFGLRGAAPDVLQGGIYEERGVVAPVGAPPRPGAVRSGTAYRLNPNGTFDDIYAEDMVPGRWSYRKVTPNTASLTLERSGFTWSLGLGFTTDTDGDHTTLVGTTVTTSQFTLIPAVGRSKIVNASALFFVRPGGAASMGFVVSDPGAMVLVRAVGPGLARFGVRGTLPAPKLSILDSRTTVIASNEGWTRNSVAQQPVNRERVATSSRLLGAFPLSTDSPDSALVALLRPGSYVAEVRPVVSTESGEVLVEVYGLP
jgi:hypothetical protein